jgi:hypothetical protein
LQLRSATPVDGLPTVSGRAPRCCWSIVRRDVPIDLVLLQWGGNRIVDDGGGLAALRTADRARTVELFPRTESALISSKAVLSWLHEDCDAGLLAAADHALVRIHVPWTACRGLDGDPAAYGKLLRW